MLSIPGHRIIIACTNEAESGKAVETELSEYIRITAVVLGVIAFVVGCFLLSQATKSLHSYGWCAISGGIVVAVLGFLIRCIRDQPAIQVQGTLNK